MQFEFTVVCQFFLCCLFVNFQSILIALLAFCSDNKSNEPFTWQPRLCLGEN